MWGRRSRPPWPRPSILRTDGALREDSVAAAAARLAVAHVLEHREAAAAGHAPRLPDRAPIGRGRRFPVRIAAAPRRRSARLVGHRSCRTVDRARPLPGDARARATLVGAQASTAPS